MKVLFPIVALGILAGVGWYTKDWKELLRHVITIGATLLFWLTV